MQTLDYTALQNSGFKGYLLPNAPERILQFGEGNFLRAFVDYFVDIANEKCGFDSKVLMVQPIASGLAPAINAQQGLYTLYLRGVEQGKVIDSKRVISCVSRCLNPYEGFGQFLGAAHNPDLRFIVSNTTEAGIAFDPACAFDDAPPASFPAKLTRFLFERYNVFGGLPGKGLVVLPCELIDDNGSELKKCVEQYTRLWKLDAGFTHWLESEVLFCPTLVDRIVTGYPRAEAEALWEQNGYRDNLLDTAEVFGLWVIEGPDSLKDELPFAKAGLPVVITDDHKPYKQRKVRILNGAHTTMCLAAYLAGQDIVRLCMEDENIYSFLHGAIFKEIIPTLTLPQNELESFANAVLERFKNPYIDHSLLAISLNSVSKWRARVLPSVLGYIQRFGKAPARLAFGFAALLQFYCGGTLKEGKLIAFRDGAPYEVTDDAAVLDFFLAHHADETGAYVRLACGNTRFWGMDLNSLPGFADAVTAHLENICKLGMAKAMDKAGQ